MTIYYTYFIGWSKHNKYYYGVKYGKDSNPSNFWKTYFTSSNSVYTYRKLNGEPDIIQIRKIFDDPEKARRWEHRVLKRMRVVHKNEWLNSTDNICFDPILMSRIGKTKTGVKNNFYGKKHSVETKNKISTKQMSTMSEEKRRRISEAIKRKHANGEYKHIYNEVTAIKISKSNSGQIPWNKGRTLTEEHKEKISISEKKTKSNKTQK